MEKSAPLISIITVCWNSLPGLRVTNASLAGLSDSSFELILIDADSTDGTKSFISSKDCWYQVVVCEADEGIYDAMNKAVHLAKGQYLLFLNAGDRLVQTIDWLAVFERLISNQAIWIGNLVLDKGGYAVVDSNCFAIRHFFHYSLPHQAAFIPRVHFDQIGDYDRDYAISADQEWFLRAISRQIPFAPLNCDIAHYAGGGVSEDRRNVSQLGRERQRMLIRSLGVWAYVGNSILVAGARILQVLWSQVRSRVRRARREF